MTDLFDRMTHYPSVVSAACKAAGKPSELDVLPLPEPKEQFDWFAQWEIPEATLDVQAVRDSAYRLSASRDRGMFRERMDELREIIG